MVLCSLSVSRNEIPVEGSAEPGVFPECDLYGEHLLGFLTLVHPLIFMNLINNTGLKLRLIINFPFWPDSAALHGHSHVCTIFGVRNSHWLPVGSIHSPHGCCEFHLHSSGELDPPVQSDEFCMSFKTHALIRLVAGWDESCCLDRCLPVSHNVFRHADNIN